MDNLKKIKKLNKHLINEMPTLEVREIPDDFNSQRKLLRALMNVRPPLPLDENFLKLQDEILSEETVEKGIVKISDIKTQLNIPNTEFKVKLWQGDITRLEVDAIVNAANSALLGCFAPLHDCIDNAIHSASGLQLRDACSKIMNEQGHEESTGLAKITPAFNLPSKFVIHTVGPIIPMNRLPTVEEENLLASCYKSCLNCAVENNLKSIAFCCISTGEFHFPNQRAAEIAVETVKNFLTEKNCDLQIVFNTFKDIDTDIYKKILS